MPRLNAKTYLKIHQRLRRLWLHDQRLFAELTPAEQWYLHDFFTPDRDHPDEELLRHRKAVTAQRPALPQQAGRALQKFWSTTAARTLTKVRAAKAPRVPAKQRRLADRTISVAAVARPEIDTKLLAKAFIELGLQRAKRQAEQEGSDPQDDTRSRP